MNYWKQQLLTAYRWGTSPARRLGNRRAAASGNAPVIVLFYHRVADTYPNGWTMSTRQFQRQVDWMRRHVDCVSIEQAQERIRNGRNRRPAVCITFDDGYADNCDFALPLLMRHQIPVTYFVTVEQAVTGQSFPHDLAAGQPLLPNSIDQLRSLAESGVEIGAHTRRHTDLGRVSDPERLYDEIVGAGRDLADLLDRSIRYFAFPYGLHENMTSQAFALARESGYQAVCSAYGGYNFPGDDSFHLQRIHADPEWARWMNWMTIDRRKVQHVERFEYCSPENPVEGVAPCVVIG